MKKWIVILLIGVIPLAGIKAQPGDGNKREDAIESLKIAFITKQLNFTPEEAQKFWPIYNQYTAELKTQRKAHTGDELEWREKALNIAKKYKPDFIKAIGQDKFNKLLKIETDWRQIVKDELQRRRDLRQNKKENKALNGF